MDTLTRRLIIAALGRGADIMDSTDPEDRSATERALVKVTKEWLAAAKAGDAEKKALIIAAVPSWKSLV